MKTLTLIISSLFILMTVSLNAQERGPQHRGPRGHMNPEEMVKKMVEQMKTELKLDEKQEKQVKELFTENFKKRGELMKKYQGQRDSMMFYNKKMEDQQNLSLKKILTEEQYKIYQTNLEKRKQEMEKRRKEGMNHHGQRGGQDNPAVKNEKQDCKECGSCGEHK
jgi:hypothetical protein